MAKDGQWKQVRRNLRSGILLGLAVAGGLSLWVLLLWLLGGTAPFERTTFSVGETILIYFLGFAFGGFSIGLLLPLRQWAAGSILLGILFLLPVYGAFSVAYDASGPNNSWMWLGVLAASTTVVGSSLGFWVWWNGQRAR